MTIFFAKLKPATGNGGFTGVSLEGAHEEVLRAVGAAHELDLGLEHLEPLTQPDEPTDCSLSDLGAHTVAGEVFEQRLADADFAALERVADGVDSLGGEQLDDVEGESQPLHTSGVGGAADRAAPVGDVVVQVQEVLVDVAEAQAEQALVTTGSDAGGDTVDAAVEAAIDGAQGPNREVLAAPVLRRVPQGRSRGAADDAENGQGGSRHGLPPVKVSRSGAGYAAASIEVLLILYYILNKKAIVY